MINWMTASLAEVDAYLDAELARQQGSFPEQTAAQYATEQRAPDPDDELEDMG